MNTIRKLLTIPAAIFGCIGGLMAGEYALSIRAYLYCPPELREGSDCYAEGWDRWPDAFLAVFAGLSALLCIGLPAVMAPSQKTYWSKWALAAGVALATCLAYFTGLLLSYVVALLCGALAVMIVERLTIRSSKDALTRAS
jgi:hypothetical protein